MRISKVRVAVAAAGIVAVVVGARLLFGGRGQPLDRWTSAESAGYSEQALDEVTRYAREVGTTGMVVLVDGKVLMEYGDVVSVGYIAGARTAILALLFGNPAASGTIDLSARIGDLGVEDLGGLLASEKRATVEQLLTARASTTRRHSSGTPRRLHPGAPGSPERPSSATSGARSRRAASTRPSPGGTSIGPSRRTWVNRWAFGTIDGAGTGSTGRTRGRPT